MKKIYVVALSAVAACGTLFTSCDNASSSKPTLKTDVDSLSYVLGATIAGQLEGQLQQMGLINDTARLAMMFKAELAAEKDSVKRLDMEKKIKTRLDSANKANQRNLSEFIKGLQEGINAQESQAAYYMGTSIGQRFSQQFTPLVDQIYDGEANKPKIDTKLFMNAVQAGVKKQEFAIADPNVWFENKMKASEEKARAKQEAELAKQYAPQIEAGKKWMEENKTKEGIVALPNGIQYKIVKAGNGPKPTASDMVSVNYTGTLIDGTKFESSYDRNQPFKFNVAGGVIKGWTEIVQLMPVGSKWTVYIPYDLAYGSADRGTIKPFSNLIFDIELLSIDTPAQQSAGK